MHSQKGMSINYQYKPLTGTLIKTSIKYQYGSTDYKSPQI